MTDAGDASTFTVLSSSSPQAQVLARLLAAIEASGLTVLGHVDHAAGARAVGLELAAEDLVLFGNPVAGTPLMQADARVGIELPLRMLVWQAPDGACVGYHDPRALASVYALAGLEQTLERMHGLLGKLAAAAAGQ